MQRTTNAGREERIMQRREAHERGEKPRKPHKRLNAPEHELPEEQLDMLGTTTFNELPKLLQQYLLNDMHQVGGKCIISDSDCAIVATTPYEDLSVAMKQRLRDLQEYIVVCSSTGTGNAAYHRIYAKLHYAAKVKPPKLYGS